MTLTPSQHFENIFAGRQKRVAFTIVYNGLHHLKHNDFAKCMAAMFHHWVIIEGAAKNNGSTAWCKQHPGDDNSTDGTVEYLNELEREYSNIHVFRGLGKWNSKDDMCNQALKMLSSELKVDEPVLLWEIDVDEYWIHTNLIKNEFALMQAYLKDGTTTGAVRWNHFVAKDLIAVGDWGGNLNTRLWFVQHPLNMRFASHEPPVLEGTTAPMELPEKCNHYSYYFEQDVYFKSRWYGGHEKVYQNWMKLQLEGERRKLKFPLHISYLFGPNNWTGQSNSHIVEFKNQNHEKGTQYAQHA